MTSRQSLIVTEALSIVTYSETVVGTLSASKVDTPKSIYHWDIVRKLFRMYSLAIDGQILAHILWISIYAE